MARTPVISPLPGLYSKTKRSHRSPWVWGLQSFIYQCGGDGTHCSSMLALGQETWGLAQTDRVRFKAQISQSVPMYQQRRCGL